VDTSLTEIYGNTFEDNAADSGGALELIDSDNELYHNRFLNNVAESKAGAITLFNTVNEDPTVLRNNIIQGNLVTDGRGGGIFISDDVSLADGGTIETQATLINNVLVGNSAGAYGAGLYVGRRSPAQVMNNIVYGNLGSYGVYVNSSTSSALVFTYNDSYLNPSNYGGALTTQLDASNISIDPLFVAYAQGDNTDDDDFHLSASSPVKDRGNPATTYNDAAGGRNDMGAYGGPDGVW